VNELAMLITVALTIPPAAKVLAISGSVYGILLGAKKIPALTQYLTGWVAVAFNVVLSVIGMVIAIPADQLYTENTALTLITAALGAAGVHGTVKSMSKPTVLATTPPDTTVKQVPATLEPVDPNAVPVENK
jgi:hypothetical protein